MLVTFIRNVARIKTVRTKIEDFRGAQIFAPSKLLFILYVPTLLIFQFIYCSICVQFSTSGIPECACFDNRIGTSCDALNEFHWTGSRRGCGGICWNSRTGTCGLRNVGRRGLCGAARRYQSNELYHHDCLMDGRICFHFPIFYSSGRSPMCRSIPARSQMY
jgi:hypothetical protein